MKYDVAGMQRNDIDGEGKSIKRQCVYDDNRGRRRGVNGMCDVAETGKARQQRKTPVRRC
jgi:hypothetical protein